MGHLFVARGHSAELASDGLLIPRYTSLNITNAGGTFYLSIWRALNITRLAGAGGLPKRRRRR